MLVTAAMIEESRVGRFLTPLVTLPKYSVADITLVTLFSVCCKSVPDD
jgi:hypothetical protein